MAKTKSNKQVRQKGKAKAKQMVPRNRFNSDAAAYYRLLRDPCNAPLVPAPYAGIGSSLLVRTTNYYQPSTGGGAGNPLDFAYEFTPWNFPTALVGGCSLPGTAITPANVNLQNFVTDSNIVKTYRPIAACLKWLPSGAISTRSGIIGMSYAPAKELGAGSILSAGDYLESSQRVLSNGADAHEVVWLPSFSDERFGAINEANITGAGSILICGLGVDALAGVVKGLIEVTVVWEWVPVTGAGLTPALNTPSSTTLQQVLAVIKDVGAFVHKHSGTMQQGMGLLGTYAAQRHASLRSY